MIPKKIHFCWFGGNPYPQVVETCIASWQKLMPDYELIEWNEKSFDIQSIQFVQEAYESKKYAYVADYVRLYALYTQGGIYLDSDVEVVQSLNPFLSHQAFTGGENSDTCVTGTMGAVKGHPWIKLLLDYYEDKSFYTEQGQQTNTVIITDLTREIYGFTESNQHRQLDDDLHIYPFEYFCAKDFESGMINQTINTFTIHHFNGSWLSEQQKKRHRKVLRYKHAINKLFGPNAFDQLNKTRKKLNSIKIFE